MKFPKFVTSVLFALFTATLAQATIGLGLQMQLGNPSNAAADTTNHTHYLINRAQYSLDFNDTTHEPNWVSWDLTADDSGGAGRSASFFQDTTLPAGFYQVLTTDYSGSGYDRGHMCPSADRTASRADNDVTFYMSNMVPQSPDNNQGVWASFETYCRTLAAAGNEILITSGPSVFAGSTVASGVAIPGYTWKIAVVVPLGPGSAVDRIIAAGAANIRVITIKIPNIAGVRSTPWQNFVTSPAVIQGDTGYTFFTALPAPIATAFLTKIDGQTATGAPVIVAQPTGQTAPVGATATFSVTATGDAPLTYQWLKNDDAIAGATADTLTLTNVQAADVATYTVVVSNAVGNVTSNGADLVVSGLPPTIVEQPTARSAAAGSNASFTVTAGGSAPFTYQWRKNGVNVANGGNLSGATTPTLTLTNVQNADTAAYDVVVSNSVSSITSGLAALTVTSAAPTITSQPANRSLAPGSTATFSVVAIGSTPLTYQWRKGGTPISGNASAATATLTLTGISLADAGSYDVLATNSFGFATSTPASLSISSASATQIFYTGGTYAQDFDTLPNTGTTFSFTGVPAGTVVPLANAPVNAGGAGGWSFSKYAGTGTTPNFQINAGSSATGGVFSYGTGAGTDRALGSLSSAGAISRFGATFVNNTGQAITQFTLSYTGEQWRHGGATTANTLTFSYGLNPTDLNTGTFTNVSALNFTGLSVSATGAALDGNAAANRTAISSTVTGLSWGPGQTLVIRWTDVDDAGSDDGLAIDNVNLSTPIVGPVGPSVASTAPANAGTGVALNAGIAITFDQAVNAAGSWFTLGSATRGALSASVTVSPDSKTYTLTPPSNYDFSENIAVTVLAANVTSTSTGLHLTANYSFAFTTAAAIPPSITTQPVSQTVIAGSNASFTVAASGTAPFSYQWRKGGAAIAGNPTASSATLALTNVQAGDIGSYDVVVSNGVGSPVLSTAATLGVTATAPVIVTQPVSQTVTAGDNVTFTVSATGSTPFAYQWRRNAVNLTDGGNLSGANSATLNLTGATLANGGTYSVVVSNGVGSPATSSNAVLLVNPLPQPFTAGNLVVVRVGSGTGSLVGTGNAVYLDEFTPAGALVQSVALPVVANGGNQPFVLGGTSTTEGGLTRSADARFLTLGGYATGTGGSASLSGTTSSAINRVVARVDAGAGVNTATVLSDWSSGSSPRGVTSLDGSTFWLSGGAGGVRFAALGATASTSISTTVANLRTIDTFGNQLYVSTQSGSVVRLGTVGTGVPATTGQTIAALPGVSLTSSPNAFFFADLDPVVPGVDTLYVADEGAATGGIVKYSLVAGTWVPNGTITAASVRGLTGAASGGKVILFASTGGSAATGGGTIFTFTDLTGYNGTVSGAASALATAPANTAFRGIAFAPGAAPTILTSPLPQLATVGDTVSFAVTASGRGTLTYQWRKDGVNLADGGIVAGAQSAQLTLTGITVADQALYDCVVTNPIGSTASAAAPLTVNKALAAVTLGNLNFTYNGAPFATTATTTPAGLTVVITYDGSPVAPVNAGSYAVVATVNDVNYTGTTTGTLVISKTLAGVTLANLNPTYTGAPLAAGVLTNPGGLAVTVTYDGNTTAPTNAGNYAVVATVNDANYSGGASGTLTIARSVAAVSLGALNQTYTGAPRAATAATTPAGLGVTLTYDGNATAPTNAGSYAVVATVNDGNYTGGASGTLTIAKAVAAVALSDLNQTYTGAPRMASATTAPAGLGVMLTYDGSVTAPTNAGSYAVTATVSDANYTGEATGTLTVAKAVAAVTLGDLSQTYDGTPRAATAATIPAGLALVLTYDGNATAPTNAGSYAVLATVDDPNYSGGTSGTLTVTKAAATVTLGNLAATYDGSPKAATATTAPGGLTVSLTYDGSTTAPTNAGSYAVVATVNDANYSGGASDTLTIAKAVAAVTLGDLNQTYTGAPRVATATTAPAGLGVTLTYDGNATAPTNAGSYTVVATVNEANYTGGASGTLAVAKAVASVALGNLNQTYTGAPRAATATTVPAGLAVLLTYNGNATAPTNAGSYAVVATVNDANYTGGASGTLTVAKAAATVTLGNLAATYDGSPKAATATTVPAGLTVSFTYNGGATAPTNAGSYAVIATINDTNYAGSASGTLVIAKAVATVTLTNLNQVYDGAPKPAGATVTPADQVAVLTYNGSGTAPTNAGSYAVVGTVNAANYTGTATGTLTIAKASSTVALGQLVQVYDGAPKPVTVTTTPAGLAVTTTYNGSATAPTNVGSYAVVATVNDANYTGSASDTLLIKPGQATIILSGLTQAYDGTPQPVTVTTTPAGLPVTVTYNGSATVPIYPGTYTVVATSTDPNRAASATDTLRITITALVRHAPDLNGGLDGSVQVLLPENTTLNGGAIVSGDVLIPGTPQLQLNGHPVYGGTIDGPGSAAPSTHKVTLNGNTVLRHVVRRTDAIAMPAVSAPPAPTGTRNVSLNNPSQSPGDFTTLRDLTLNGNGIALAIPAGTYGSLTLNGNNRIILGVAGSASPVVYNLQGLTLNGTSQVQVVGPVIINLASGNSLNGSIGNPDHPDWLTVNIAAGGLTLNGNAACDGVVVAPAGTVVLNGSSTLHGRVVCDRLTISGTGLLTEFEP